MRGKYSPTLYLFKENPRIREDGYDADGYDMYGYNKDGVDRAGNTETDYLLDADLFERVSNGGFREQG